MDGENEEEDGGAGEAQITADDLRGALEAEDLKRELPEQDWETLTVGDDKVGVRCLLKAKVFVKAMVQSTGHKYDEANEICREAVLKRGLYELFSFVGQEERARDKEEDAELLIESAFGPIRKKTDQDGAAGPAAGFVKGGRKSPLSRNSREWE
ncbi:MAG: hypothetical protein IK015_04510 [Treponema sp.]|nr:hypothetical protein [Treponema sp.]